MYRLGTQSMRNLVGVHPYLAFAVMKAIKVTSQDFSVVEGVRSMSRQRELVAKGRSKTFNSYHLYGLATDLVPFVNGKKTWEDRYFKEIHNAMSSVIEKYNLPIDNGFDLWNWDKPHWQMTGWREKYDIRKIDPKCFKG